MCREWGGLTEAVKALGAVEEIEFSLEIYFKVEMWATRHWCKLSVLPNLHLIISI